MKYALVFAAFLAVVVAEPPSSYGPPSAPLGNFGNSGGYDTGSSGGYEQEEAYQSQTFKNVYVYSAPDEPVERNSRVIRVPGGDKHVNIIFVKTPSQDSQQQTEVILPEQDEHKNLVYVLLKKGENNADVKIRRPAPRPQPKPEVNFIRFQENKPDNSYGVPAAAPVRTPSTSYGANF